MDTESQTDLRPYALGHRNPERTQTSDPKTENLNQFKDPHYVAHLHKSIIENLTPRDTDLERVQRQHILETDPKQRRDISFYNKIPKTTVDATHPRIQTHKLLGHYHLEQKPRQLSDLTFWT